MSNPITAFAAYLWNLFPRGHETSKKEAPDPERGNAPSSGGDEISIVTSHTPSPSPVDPCQQAIDLVSLPLLSFFHIKPPTTYTEEESRAFLATFTEFVSAHRSFLPTEMQREFGPSEVVADSKLANKFLNMFYGQLLVTCFGEKLKFPEKAKFEEKVWIASTWCSADASPGEKDEFYARFSTEKPEECESLECVEKGLPFIPLEISLLTNLKSANFSKNCLTHLPYTLRTSPLTDLYLSENQIVEFPDEILSLTHLSVLDMTRNHLERIPEINALFEVRKIFLQENCISTLPSSLSSLGQLETFDVSNNPSLKRLPCLEGLKRLDFLSCNGCSVESVPEGFSTLERLRWCDFSGNKLGAFPSVEGFSSLSVLDLAQNRMKAPPQGLESHPQIRFSLSGNPLDVPLTGNLFLRQESFEEKVRAAKDRPVAH